jgi:hypothetical protein
LPLSTRKIRASQKHCECHRGAKVIDLHATNQVCLDEPIRYVLRLAILNDGLSFRIGRGELAAGVANLTPEKSSRQLCRHILPVADMETTSYIRYLLASGAVWNVNLNNCPRSDAILCHSMCRDERRLPLDARPTLGAVSLVVPIVKAGGHQEQRFVRGKRINADVMRCLQSALTFPRFRIWSQDLRGVTCRGGRF